jgi:hypothetical protein
MIKSFTRIISLLLVPCLMTVPVTASALANPPSPHDWARPLFEQEALGTENDFPNPDSPTHNVAGKIDREASALVSAAAQAKEHQLEKIRDLQGLVQTLRDLNQRNAPVAQLSGMISHIIRSLSGLQPTDERFESPRILLVAVAGHIRHGTYDSEKRTMLTDALDKVQESIAAHISSLDELSAAPNTGDLPKGSRGSSGRDSRGLSAVDFHNVPAEVFFNMVREVKVWNLNLLEDLLQRAAHNAAEFLSEKHGVPIHMSARLIPDPQTSNRVALYVDTGDWKPERNYLKEVFLDNVSDLVDSIGGLEMYVEAGEHSLAKTFSLRPQGGSFTEFILENPPYGHLSEHKAGYPVRPFDPSRDIRAENGMDRRSLHQSLDQALQLIAKTRFASRKPLLNLLWQLDALG